MRSNGIFYGWVMAGAFFVTAFAGWGTAQGAFGVFVNPLADDMGWSRTAVSAAFSINIAVGFIFGILWGWLTDRWSIRGVLALSGVLLGLGVFLASTADSLWYFYLFYGFVAGTGLGGIAGPMSALLAKWFDQRPGLGLALGLGTAGIHAGVSALPILAEYLISVGGWRLGFQVLSYVIWAGLLGAAVMARAPRRAAEDFSEANIPLSEAEDSGGLPSATPAPGREADNSSDTDIPLSEAIRTVQFWLLLVMLMAGFILVMMVAVHLVPRATDAGVASSTAATLLTAVGVLSLVGAVIGGALVDRFGGRRVYIGAMVIEAAAFVWLVFSSELWMFYVFAIIFGVSHGSWSPQIAAIIAKVFGVRHLGAIYGATLVGAGIGAVIGPIVAGLFFDLTGAYTVAFLLDAIIAGLAVVVGFVLSERAVARGEARPRSAMPRKH